ncbi:cell division control protein 14, SIN component-domain-containing protein [Mycena amicta]|nr:cell division control protein 14, SIN component-domain-containing protein [Mycena amicta]
MEDRFSDLKSSIQDALDDLSSPRSSSETRTQALRTLERLLAASFAPKRSTDDMDYFLALQYTFECNVPLRLLGWIVASTARIDILTTKGASDETDAEVATLSSQLALSLSIMQGVCLTHSTSKAYLGRRYSLEVLLDLFIASRHLSSTPVKSTTAAAPLPLASVILDTLLCILVDSSPALRVFESCQGVHAIVKILKRAGTPREVRMKCLEFLYFYLLDETSPSPSPSPSTLDLPSAPTPAPTPAPTAPSTPVNVLNKKPFVNGTPSRPISRYGSSTFSLTSSAFATSDESSSSSASSSRSTSGSSTSSFSSTSSNAGSTSPKKHAQILLPAGTPRQPQPQPRALLMLRKDLDFVPLSPKKPFGDSPGTPLRAQPRRTHARTRSRLVSSSSTSSEEEAVPAHPAPAPPPAMEERSRTTSSDGETVRGDDDTTRAKTTEEKKRLLSTMLGNVEALVDGVRKAGIWGLG